MSSVGVEKGDEEEKREGFEEWDADFLDQLIQVEELALSSSSSSVNPNNLDLPPPPSFPSFSLPSTAAATIAASTHTPAAVTFSYLPPASSQQPPQSLYQRPPHYNDLISYSPPRVLSQRVVHSNAVFDAGPSDSLVPQPNSNDLEICLVHKDLEIEIDRLKGELEHVSKQLADSEHECFELRKEKRRREEQIKSRLTRTEESVLGVHCRRTSEYEACTVDTNGIAWQSKNGKGLQDQIGYRNDTGALPSSSKIMGVQAGKADDPTEIDDGLNSGLCLSEKLLGIWGCTSYQKLERNLISNLFMVCPADFHVIFGCTNMSMCSKIPMGSLAGDSSSCISLQSHMRPGHTFEGAKVCDLFSLLAKIGNGLLPLEALVGPLVDLCNVENVPVLHSSIHILHVFLKHLFSLRRKLEGRDNARVEGLLSGKSTNVGGTPSVSNKEASSTGWSPFVNTCLDPQYLFKEDFMKVDFATSLSCMEWLSVFESMHQIAVKNTEEYVRLEAISVMNVVLMRNNSFKEREKFGSTPVFEGIAQLLKKEAGSHVQKKTLHLLYLLLNCPKLLGIFCSGCKEGEGAIAINDERIAASSKGFSLILDGLANCLSCCGNSLQDMELRKRAVTLLAFLASSGKSGFEILVGHNLTGAPNFVVLILHVLVSEMDAEASVSFESAERAKARTLLIREALILLNRLVSNPGYSSTMLRILTAARDIASLTIDIASRLSQHEQRSGQVDSMTWKIRETEIADLARVFKKRVWSYLGDKIS